MRSPKKAALAATVMLFALVLPFALAVGASAYDDYPFPGLDPDAMIVDEWHFYMATCTSFVCWRMIEVNGVEDFSCSYGHVHWGNANQWDEAAISLGITVDDVPAVGAIAQTDRGSDLGHVAWVAAVDGDQVTIEEYNYVHLDSHGAYTGSRRYNLRTVPASTFRYIHVKDLEGTYDIASGQVILPQSETETQTETQTETEAVPAALVVTEALPETEAPQTETQSIAGEPRSALPTVIVAVWCALALCVGAAVAVGKIRAKKKSAEGEEKED